MAEEYLGNSLEELFVVRPAIAELFLALLDFIIEEENDRKT